MLCLDSSLFSDVLQLVITNEARVGMRPLVATENSAFDPDAAFRLRNADNICILPWTALLHFVAMLPTWHENVARLAM